MATTGAARLFSLGGSSFTTPIPRPGRLVIRVWPEVDCWWPPGTTAVIRAVGAGVCRVDYPPTAGVRLWVVDARQLRRTEGAGRSWSVAPSPLIRRGRAGGPSRGAQRFAGLRALDCWCFDAVAGLRPLLAGWLGLRNGVWWRLGWRQAVVDTGAPAPGAGIGMASALGIRRALVAAGIAGCDGKWQLLRRDALSGFAVDSTRTVRDLASPLLLWWAFVGCCWNPQWRRGRF